MMYSEFSESVTTEIYGCYYYYYGNYNLYVGPMLRTSNSISLSRRNYGGKYKSICSNLSPFHVGVVEPGMCLVVPDMCLVVPGMCLVCLVCV